MKQVFNWTIGSFFRTIGRTIAFLVMGGLIYYILTTNGFEFGIKDLFLDNVKAMTLDGEYVRPFDTGTNGYWYFDLSNQQSDQKDVNFASTFTPREGEKYIVVAIQGGEQYTWEDDYNASNNYNQGVVNLYYRISLKSNGAWQTCELQNNLIVCPIKYGDSYTGIRFYLDNPYNYSGSVYIKMNQYISIYKNINTEIQNAINNQTQQQQQNHEETQNYLEDSNTTQAESEATDFFEDFDAPDVGGLSAIITAPLNTIRSLLNSSCTNLVLPLPYLNNQNLTLPCMYSIYTQHFGAFFTIYQTIILAIVAYRCIRSIYFDLHGFTNPNDDRIEVMDL